MAKYSISEIPENELPSTELKKYYSECKKDIRAKEGKYPRFDFTDLDYIFDAACNNRYLFTAKNVGENPTPQKYIKRWILAYCKAKKNPPSKRAAAAKSSCNDPMIETMLEFSQNIDNIQTSQKIFTHNLCMSAENVLGNLLEEFIAHEIRPYGWIWCTGETLRAIDFCNESGTTLLQIKNKSNSENSSSSSIREGTIIKKWHRLGSSKKKGVIYPSYQWDKLNAIINKDLPKGTKQIALTEDDFRDFVTKTVKANHEIITGE